MQNLNIGAVIKKLRIDKDINQEDLAKFLGVSTPAISKWENGNTYPDITLLPTIANYFNVSIDDLMNYKSDLKDREIEVIIEKIQNLLNKDVYKAISMFEEYLKGYPKSYKLKVELSKISLLVISKLEKDEEKAKNLIQKCVDSLEEVAISTCDIEIKEEALFRLSVQYMFLDEIDKAKDSLNKIHKPIYNPDIMLPNLYILEKNFLDARKMLQTNLMKSVAESISSCWQLGMSYYNKNDMDLDKATTYFKLGIEIAQVEKDLIGVELCYVYLSNVYLDKGDYEGCIKTLNELLDEMEVLESNKDKLYYDLIDYKVDIKLKYKTLLPLINQLFVSISSKNEFKDVINRLEDKIQ